MDFALFTLLGLAVAFGHLWLPGEHRVGPASAFTLGVTGAWGGATVAGAFVPGMLSSLSSGLATAGSLAGAVGAIAFMEVVTDRYLRHHPDEATRAPW
ncbi:hypothetical protein [Anaeromyxobacter diazotrophicus]|uniref:Uncharacterized protein n=1 Tax=Anaeromyxobacter diazotrophicus TaxID=2590199 RepID=A0A7I9VLS8_9BACT|nr:hypothetical protein [Anaeromyxobacter diazotrophicus]GEJ57351.1 hypothetical protein AMYX_20920 [Anaeromyxobacter diazotrophicus]